MTRWLPCVTVTVVCSLPFASCTCQRDLPEPPRQIQRQSGFSAALPTARRPPDEQLARNVTPIPRTLPRVVESPPPLENVELPEDFPGDVPLFEDAEVFAVQELAQNAQNVLFHIDAESSEVFKYYRDSMRGEGWDLSQEYQNQDQSFLSFRKGRMITNMTVSKDPRTGRRVMAIMYYEEEELPFPEF